VATSLRGIRGVVYVVDDDAGVRRALTRLIRQADLEVLGFASAEEFLELAPVDDKPACLVVDLVLPGHSGLDLQGQLARRGCDLPIIFISGRGSLESGVQAMKGGAVDFLEKPVSQEILSAAIERALERARSSRTSTAERRRLSGRAERLTPREREVFGLVVEGLPNKEVGAKLGTTEKTVKVHRARVMEKMEADSLPDLVRMADKLGPGGP